jgi:hypothetical protein
MSILLTFVLLSLTQVSSVHADNDSIVQFIVYADRQSDVSKVFPGAQIDHSWNNLFVVSLWTKDPDTLIRDAKQQLEASASTLQTIIPPFQIGTATQKWIEYNLVWVAVLLLLFLTGCACGGAAVAKCSSLKRAVAKPYAYTTISP